MALPCLLNTMMHFSGILEPTLYIIKLNVGVDSDCSGQQIDYIPMGIKYKDLKGFVMKEVHHDRNPNPIWQQPHQ